MNLEQPYSLRHARYTPIITRPHPQTPDSTYPANSATSGPCHTPTTPTTPAASTITTNSITTAPHTSPAAPIHARCPQPPHPHDAVPAPTHTPTHTPLLALPLGPLHTIMAAASSQGAAASTRLACRALLSACSASEFELGTCMVAAHGLQGAAARAAKAGRASLCVTLLEQASAGERGVEQCAVMEERPVFSSHPLATTAPAATAPAATAPVDTVDTAPPTATSAATPSPTCTWGECLKLALAEAAASGQAGAVDAIVQHARGVCGLGGGTHAAVARVAGVGGCPTRSSQCLVAVTTHPNAVTRRVQLSTAPCLPAPSQAKTTQSAFARLVGFSAAANRAMWVVVQGPHPPFSYHPTPPANAAAAARRVAPLGPLLRASIEAELAILASGSHSWGDERCEGRAEHASRHYRGFVDSLRLLVLMAAFSGDPPALSALLQHMWASMPLLNQAAAVAAVAATAAGAGGDGGRMRSATPPLLHHVGLGGQQAVPLMGPPPDTGPCEAHPGHQRPSLPPLNPVGPPLPSSAGQEGGGVGRDESGTGAWGEGASSGGTSSAASAGGWGGVVPAWLPPLLRDARALALESGSREAEAVVAGFGGELAR